MNGTVSVTHKLGEVNGTLSEGPPKTKAGRRIVGIPSFVARSLAMHIDLYAMPGNNGLVFPSIEGIFMRRSNFRRRVWEPATAEAGVSGLRFHDLRVRHEAPCTGRDERTRLRPVAAGRSKLRAA